MRLKEKQVTDRAEILDIIKKCERCRLGFSEDGIPYVIPINYGFTFTDGVLTLFFHCAGEGRKIDVIKKNPLVCFEIDCHTRIDPGQNPDKFAIIYESLVGTGTMEFVNDFNEKRTILGNMIRKFRSFNPLYHPNPLTDNRVDEVTIMKLVLDEYKAKRAYHL
jgi:nitroimidazol reductase NimA-like FMN-containing flavoprotein (pyridoxamine 5'-phosphate oxidase superfamily)